MAVSLRNIVSQLQQAGRGGDTMLAHINPREAQMLKSQGGAGTINPKTGLREFRPTGSWGGGAASGGRVSGSLGNTGNGGNVGGGARRNAGVNPGNANLGLSGPTYSGPSGTGTGVDGSDPNNDRTTSSGGRGPSADRSWSSSDAPVGGGTYTTDQYSPGAVGNFPDANAAAVADMLSSALPGMGLTNTAYKGAKSAMDGSDPLSANAMGPIGDAFGGDPGPQNGWAPDRNHGAVNPFGGNGAAQGTVFQSPKPKIVLSPLAAALGAQPQPAYKTYSSATTVV